MNSKWITWIIILIMFACMVFIGYYFYKNAVNECTANPLQYAAKQVEEIYPSADIILGEFIIIKEGYNPTRISFNSTNISFS